MTDKQLFELCKSLGKASRDAQAKFAEQLPEVQRRKLWEKKGFSSIFHFAFVLGGLSKFQVETVLRVEKKVQDKPALRKVLHDGKVSYSKMARVVSIVDAENQNEIAKMARTLSKRALETWVRDQKFLPGQRQNNTEMPEVKLDADVRERLNDLQNKGIDINELIREALDKRDQEIAEAYVETPAKSRYVPAPVKRAIKKEHGTKCSIPECCREAENLHHTRRFALSKSHNPAYIAPLCQAHHEIAHKIDHAYNERAGFLK